MQKLHGAENESGRLSGNHLTRRNPACSMTLENKGSTALERQVQCEVPGSFTYVCLKSGCQLACQLPGAPYIDTIHRGDKAARGIKLQGGGQSHGGTKP